MNVRLFIRTIFGGLTTTELGRSLQLRNMAVRGTPTKRPTSACGCLLVGPPPSALASNTNASKYSLPSSLIYTDVELAFSTSPGPQSSSFLKFSNSHAKQFWKKSLEVHNYELFYFVREMSVNNTSRCINLHIICICTLPRSIDHSAYVGANKAQQVSELTLLYMRGIV